jgi:holo-[acyl-carrier protein] synthase
VEVVGIGVDLVDVERIEQILSRRGSFAERVFSAEEIAYCDAQGNRAACFAARWAAREAARKALGGVSRMRWKDVRVELDENGAPSIHLEGASLARAREIGVSRVLVSLSHERKTVAAFCLAVRA